MLNPSQAARPMHLVPLVIFLLLPVAGTEAQQPPKAWRIPESPILSIGTRDAEGPESFGAIAGAVRLSSGVVVVADRKSRELRFFSPTGKHLKTAGRDGGGPGEFRSMATLQRCAADSVFVYDPALSRLSVFSPDGAYVRAADLRKWSPNGLPPNAFQCNPARVMAFVRRLFEAPKGIGPLRPRAMISLLGPDDSLVSLGTFPATEMYFKDMQAGPRPLGKETSLGVGSNSIYVGTGDAFEVAEFSLRGERLGVLREARAPVPVTAAQVTAYIGEFVARAPGGVNSAGYEKYFRELEWPKEYPAYARLMVDWADNLWIEEYPIPGKAHRDWTIYSRSGAKAAVISLPSSFRLLEAGRDYVLGVWRDEFDVDYLRVYALVK